MTTDKKYYQKPLFWILFAFVFSLITVRYVKPDIWASEAHPDFVRGWYYGDDYSERNVETAAHFFRDHGFRETSGLPMYYHVDSIPNSGFVYMHYPPMAEWLGGITATVTGSYDRRILGVIPFVMSICLFFMIYGALGKWLKDDRAAFIGASFLVLSNYFIAWSTDIHQHTYVEFFRWSFLILWWRYLTESPKQKYLIAVLAFCYAMMCLLSFEPYVYIAIVIVGLPLAMRQQIVRWEVAVLLIVPVACFVLRLALNANYLGGWDAMFADIKKAFLMRTGTTGDTDLGGGTMNLRDYLLGLPKIRLHRLGHFYILPSLVLVMIYIMGMIRIRQKDRLLFRICIVLWIASLSWACLMPQHAYIHIFTLRHIGIFMGLTIGSGLIFYARLIIRHRKQRNIPLLCFHGIIIAYSLFYVTINTVYFLYLKYGFLYPHLGIDKYELFDTFLM